MTNLIRLCILLVSLLAISASWAQEKFTISGYVTDQASGEAQIGANVFIQELLQGGAANTYGFYSITVEQGEYTLKASFLGFRDFSKQIVLDKDLRINIEMASAAIITQEVEIFGERSEENTEGTQMGTIDIEAERLQTLPALLGEVDILKSIQYLPGVASNGEGNSGFYVRGGGPDQNLILLDEATVYNATHLFGFFSVFNADAIKNIELIKGGMPANYGGRISSVLDINMKDGNDKELHGQGGIGLISSRLTLEGPIVKGKSSFIVSGRRTYIDVLTKPFISDTSAFGGSGYYFYDINAKANYRLSDDDRFYLSGYFGRDVFTFGTSDPGDPQIKIPWGNTIVAARWNHLFSDKLFLNTTATFSDYSFEFDLSQDQFAFNLFSGIKDYGLKLDFNHYPTVRHSLKYGTQYILHKYTTSSVTARSGDTEFNIEQPPLLTAHEMAFYGMDDFDLTDEIRINAGVRLTYFAHVGEYTEKLFDENGDRIGTREFGSGERVTDFFNFEPRFSMRYKLNERSSLKASFNQGQQYVHLASFSSIALPTDVWIPSSQNVKPLVGTQYAAGYFRDLKDRVYETSAEVYYKDMRNLVEYEEGAQPQDNGVTNYDGQLVYGDGYSYGLELFVKKRTGKLNGWVGYTWSKTMRQFPDINNGNEFPSRWDRRHDLSIVAAYDRNDRWTYGMTFLYATGQAVTLPVNRYFIEGQLVSEFTERNGFRMVPYHRLDLSATLHGKHNKKVTDPDTGEEIEVKKKFRSNWTFGVYNVYNRANPYFIYFGNEGDVATGNFKVTANQVSLFSVLPSVTWNFEF